MKKFLAFIIAVISLFGACLCVGCGSKEEPFVGLYDETEPEEVKFTYTNDNMLYDFEEKEACVRNMSFDCVFGNASLNTDKKYVTCGNGSLKLEVYGRTDGSWSITYFDINSKYSDFTNVKSVKLDVMYITEDSSDRAISFGVWSSNSNRCETASKVRAKSGEWYTYDMRMQETMEACTIGGVWNFNVKWKKSYMKNMTRIYISLPPFSMGQKPVTLYVDNIRVEYL